MKKRNRSMFNHLFSLRRAPGNIARPVAVLLCLLAFGMIHALWRDRLPMAPAAVSAQKTNASPDDLWQDGADPASQFPRTERAALPQSYRAVRLNQESLARLLNQVPPAFAGAAEGANVEITLPMPDGSRSRFKIEEAPVLPPGLAARYPEIKTYRGRAVDHPTVTVRFSWTPIGFHAMVFSEQEAVNIEPITQGETANYISY